MAIPDLTQSNPLSDALEETTNEYLNPNSLYVPPVTTPQSMIQQQQMQLDMGNLQNAMFWSGSNSPLGRAIMPDSLSTGYAAGKGTLGSDVDFSKFNKKFLQDYYSRNVEGFDSFDDWIREDDSKLMRGLLEGSVDLKANEKGMFFSPAQYKDSSMKSSLQRDIDLQYYNKMKKVSDKEIKDLYGYDTKEEFMKNDPTYKFLSEYLPALESDKGYTPPGLFSRPWGQDYTYTGDDYRDLERRNIVSGPEGGAEALEGLLTETEIKNGANKNYSSSSYRAKTAGY